MVVGDADAPAGYEIGPAAADLSEIGALYADANFRPDLIDDLSYVRTLGGSIFTATHGGEVVGASSCLPFVGTGWVGGVVVAQSHGRKGVGGRLTRAAVATLHADGAGTVLLHATPMAAELYRRMGFVPEAEFAEFIGLPTESTEIAEVRDARAGDLDEVLALDRLATGEDRDILLRSLWPGSGLVHDDGRVRGFVLPQSPTAVGAVVADDERVGEPLLWTALGRRRGLTRVPVIADRPTVTGRLRRLGFTEHIRTTRMRLGPPAELHPASLVSAFNLYWG